MVPHTFLGQCSSLSTSKPFRKVGTMIHTPQLRSSWRKAGLREISGSEKVWTTYSFPETTGVRVMFLPLLAFHTSTERCVISLLCKLNCRILYRVIAGLGWVTEMSKISEVREENNSCSADTLWIWNLILWHFPGEVSQPSFISVSGTGRGIAHKFEKCNNTPRAEGVHWCMYLHESILLSKPTTGRCIFHSLPVQQGSQMTAYESNNVKLKHVVEGKFHVWPSKHLSDSKLFSASFLWSYFLGDLPIKWAFI